MDDALNKLGKKAGEALNTGVDAAANTGKVFKNLAVGGGESAGGVAKGAANKFLDALNGSLKVMRDNPKVTAFFVSIAAGFGIFSWFKRRKQVNAQTEEAATLQASITANRAAVARMSAELGQTNPVAGTGHADRARGGVASQPNFPG